MKQTSSILSALVLAIFAVAPLPAAADLLYVTLNNNTVVTYDISLSTGGAIASSASTFANTNMNTPYGLAFDTSGNLYVANLLGNTVSKYDSSGGYLSNITTNVSSPVGVVFDSSGNLYVSNIVGNFSNTISKFDSSGAYLSNISGNLNNPNGMVFDSSGNLYVANQNGNTISKFDSAGGFLSTIGNATNLNTPRGLAFDSAGNLYVSNGSTSPAPTISTFDSSGTFLSTFANTNLSSPRGLVFDSSGNLYVANQNGNTISKFDSAGDFVFSWNVAAQPRYMAFAPTPVPEPATWMLGLGAVACGGIGTWRRRLLRKVAGA